MEVKSVGDCLKVYDHVIIKNIAKYIGVSDLENVHKYLLEIGQSDYIEDRVAVSNVLSQKNSVIENHYQFTEKDKKSEYIQLRKLILAWLIECSTEPEIDDQK